MEGSPLTNDSPINEPELPRPIEKTFLGGFLKLRDGHINQADYEAMRADPSVAIKAFCLHRTADLKPPYSIEEVDAFEEKLGQSLDSLKTYLTEVSRETVFGYYRHLIALKVPTQERILGTATKERRALFNPEQTPSTLLRITTDGCAFSKALVIKGHFLGTVWALSDDEPELIAPDFETWLYMGMKHVMVDMMHKKRIEEAGGKAAYMEQRRKAAADKKAATKKPRSAAQKESLRKLHEMHEQIKNLQAKMKAYPTQAEPDKL